MGEEEYAGTDGVQCRRLEEAFVDVNEVKFFAIGKRVFNDAIDKKYSSYVFFETTKGGGHLGIIPFENYEDAKYALNTFTKWLVADREGYTTSSEYSIFEPPSPNTKPIVDLGVN